MGAGDEIPNFMSGKPEDRGGGGTSQQDQLAQAIDLLGQNQQRLGASHAVTQQALMFFFSFMLRTVEAPQHVKEAFAEGMQRILQGEDPEEVHRDLRKNLASPGIIKPGDV